MSAAVGRPPSRRRLRRRQQQCRMRPSERAATTKAAAAAEISRGRAPPSPRVSRTPEAKRRRGQRLQSPGVAAAEISARAAEHERRRRRRRWRWRRRSSPATSPRRRCSPAASPRAPSRSDRRRAAGAQAATSGQTFFEPSGVLARCCGRANVCGRELAEKNFLRSAFSRAATKVARVGPAVRADIRFAEKKKVFDHRRRPRCRESRRPRR